MLVLSRKKHESLTINAAGTSIRVVVVRIGPNAVRIGIEAPLDITVVRDELVPEVSNRESS